jgi:hypothetical protein
VRQRAYKIMSKGTLQSTAQRMSVKPLNKLALHWQAVDGLAERIRRHLRPLSVTLDFASIAPDSPWLAALTWAKSVFAKQQRLSQRPLAECPAATLPKRLRPYLLTFDAEGKPTGLHADRYEFWLYRQIRKRFQSGELSLADSLQHRHFSDELVLVDEKADVLTQMDISFLRQPVDVQLDALAAELPRRSSVAGGRTRCGSASGGRCAPVADHAGSATCRCCAPVCRTQRSRAASDSARCRYTACGSASPGSFPSGPAWRRSGRCWASH